MCAVRVHAFLLGPAGIWDGGWIALAAALVTADDVGTWPYSVGILFKWVTFLSPLHWPEAGVDLAVGGVPFVELLILYELWAGGRLVLVKAFLDIKDQGVHFQCRLFLFGPGIDIWRSCRFIGALMRSHSTLCLVVLVGLCLAGLGPIIAG